MKMVQDQARETTFVRFSEQGAKLWWVLAMQSGVSVQEFWLSYRRHKGWR
jgi:hypothetical protein